jgi:hypothetical protein
MQPVISLDRGDGSPRTTILSPGIGAILKGMDVGLPALRLKWATQFLQTPGLSIISPPRTCTLSLRLAVTSSNKVRRRLGWGKELVTRERPI